MAARFSLDWWPRARESERWARNPGAARFPLEVEVVRGDLTLPETLDACLNGIDTVFLVWTAPAAAVAPALERITKHARRIVFLSAPIETPHPLFPAFSRDKTGVHANVN